MKKAKAKAVKAKRAVKSKRAAKSKRKPPGSAYTVHGADGVFEVRNPAKREIFGGFSKRLHAENAARVLNSLKPRTTSSLLD